MLAAAAAATVNATDNATAPGAIAPEAEAMLLPTEATDLPLAAGMAVGGSSGAGLASPPAVSRPALSAAMLAPTAPGPTLGFRTGELGNTAGL